MGKQRGRLEEVRFLCVECDWRFDAAPVRVEETPEDDWHPWRYFARCTLCDRECEQEPRSRHLLKMWSKATGPRTAEGKEAVAGNLKHGPEQTKRTRFNALKHGLNARVATYWPAKPGAYAQCEACEYRDNVCRTAVACQKKTDLFFQHHVAFEVGDPRLLTDLNADLHANLRAIINDMILAVIQDGARLKTPQWYYDHQGCFHLARTTDEETGETIQLYDLSEHPLIKRIGEFITRIGLSLSDMEMTPKAQSEDEMLRGFVSQQGSKPENLVEFQERQTRALEQLGDLVKRSRDRAARDPVLIEHDHGGSDSNG